MGRIPRIARTPIVVVLMTIAILAATTAGAIVRYGSIGHALACVRGERFFIDEPVKALGDVEAGRVYRVAFRLHNDSDREIRIVGFSSSCGCTSLTDLPMAIPPLTARPLWVTFKPKTSDVSRTSDTSLRIFTDMTQAPEVGLRLVANVVSNHASSAR